MPLRVTLILVALLPAIALAEDAPALSPVEQLVREVEQSFARGDGAAFARRADDAAFLRRSLDGLPINEPAVARFARRVSFGKSVAAQISATVRAGGTYRLLRVRDLDGQPRPVMRLLGADGIDYHEWILAADSTGGLRIVDLHVYSSGETMSRTVRRTLLPGILARHEELAERVAPAERELIRQAPRLSIADRFAAEGRPDAAAAVLAELPPEVLDQPVVFLRYIELTQDPAKRAAAIDRYRSVHTDSAAVDLLILKLASRSPMREAGAAAAERLEKAVGRDGALDLMRSRVVKAAGDDAGALRLAEQALQRAPDLPDVYYPPIDAALAADDHAHTVELLLAAERNAGVTWSDLTAIDAFKKFVASPQYEEWKQARIAIQNRTE